MSYKIVVDSCCDLTDAMKKDSRIQSVPLTLNVGNVEIIDDAAFDQKSYLRLVAGTPECPKTACPSPAAYLDAYDCDADAVFVITLSEHLSGSCQSAFLAKNMYEEEDDSKQIFVIGSDSASVGETNLALKIMELTQSGMPFKEVYAKVMEYRDSMKTYFVLETLDFLRKNGRLTGVKGAIATALSIKPVMSADSGVIKKLDQAIGIHKAHDLMCRWVKKEARFPEKKILGIAHTNCPERAERLKSQLLSMLNVSDVYIVNTGGVSSTYAGDGGVICAL